MKGVGKHQLILNLESSRKILAALSGGEWMRYRDIVESARVGTTTASKFLKLMVAAGEARTCTHTHTYTRTQSQTCNSAPAPLELKALDVAADPPAEGQAADAVWEGALSLLRRALENEGYRAQVAKSGKVTLVITAEVREVPPEPTGP